MSSTAFFQRNILDSQLRFGQESAKSYLRVQNFPNTLSTGAPDLFVEVGVAIAVTGQAGGYTDILIDPPAVVAEQDMMIPPKGAYNAEEDIWSGSQAFIISHTFVKNQMALLGLTDGQEEAVFTNRSPNPNSGNPVIGIVYDNRMFTIERIGRAYYGGEIVKWHILGKAWQQGV